jgi:hypothetical protein
VGVQDEVVRGGGSCGRDDNHLPQALRYLERAAGVPLLAFGCVLEDEQGTSGPWRPDRITWRIITLR